MLLEYNPNPSTNYRPSYFWSPCRYVLCFCTHTQQVCEKDHCILKHQTKNAKVCIHKLSYTLPGHLISCPPTCTVDDLVSHYHIVWTLLPPSSLDPSHSPLLLPGSLLNSAPWRLQGRGWKGTMKNLAWLSTSKPTTTTLRAIKMLYPRQKITTTPHSLATNNTILNSFFPLSTAYSAHLTLLNLLMLLAYALDSWFISRKR